MHTAASIRAWTVLSLCIAANVWFQHLLAVNGPADHRLGLPPSASLLRAATLGESAAAGYLSDLYLQNFNVQLGRVTPLAAIDRGPLIKWLDLANHLDPDAGYPLLLASRHFAETGEFSDRRVVLDWVYQRFLERPDQRWPWLVHAVFVARHVIDDPHLAEFYAAALRTHVHDPNVPVWVRQMDLLLRADLGETADAKAILAGLVAAGQIRSPAELKFLEARVEAAPNTRATD